MTGPRRSRLPFFAGLLAAFALVSGWMAPPTVAFVQGAPSTTASAEQESTPTSVPGAEADGPADEAAQKAERKRKLRLAILTGGLIAVTGLALVALTMLGGSATRRRLRRKPLAEGPPPLEPVPAERFDDEDLPPADEASDEGTRARTSSSDADAP